MNSKDILPEYSRRVTSFEMEGGTFVTKEVFDTAIQALETSEAECESIIETNKLLLAQCKRHQLVIDEKDKEISHWKRKFEGLDLEKAAFCILNIEAKERYNKALSFIENDVDMLYCDSPVYSESGYYYTDVDKALKIASGYDSNDNAK